jgi:hypothetical protein
METINLYDVASQAIFNCVKKAEPAKVKSILLTLPTLLELVNLTETIKHLKQNPSMTLF